MDVKEILKVGTNATVLVCPLFSDEEIKDAIASNLGLHTNFVVEEPKYCFSEPTTRNIVLLGSENYDAIKTIRFVEEAVNDAQSYS